MMRMNRDTVAILKDSNSDIPCTNLYVKDTECIRKWKNCKGKSASTCKKVKLDPTREKLNTKFCINAAECFKYNENNCNNNCNYSYGYFNNIVLLIFLFIIFQEICCRRPMWI